MSEPRPFSFLNWLKANVALMPLMGLTVAAAFIFADSHNDQRYVQKETGQEVQTKVDAVAADVQDIKVKQAVNAEQIRAIGSKVDDVQRSQDQINNKLDRLIERK